MKTFRKHSGKVFALDRDDVDTDQIIPKQFLKRVERTGFGQFLFHDWRANGEVDIPEGVSILVTGRNFGCGSSREHAPWALDDFGFRAIIAPSFADIFYANCTKVGILPVVMKQEEVATLMGVGQATVDLEKRTVSAAGISYSFEIDGDVRQRLLGGLDEISLTLEHEADIAAYEKERWPVG